MSEWRAGSWVIRHLFHCDPGTLTLRRFCDLAGKGAAHVRSLASKPPPVQAPSKDEHF